MRHPLDDSTLKVGRAQRLADELQRDVAAYERAYPIQCSREVDEEKKEERFRFADPPELPREWAVRVGEIAHNARSALNYIVAAGVRRAGATLQLSNDFPIFTDEDRYLAGGANSHRNRKLRGVPEPIKKKIDDIQPFHVRKRAPIHPLALLQALNNPDKHETMWPAWAQIVTPGGTVQMIGSTAWREANVVLRNGVMAEAWVGPLGDIGSGDFALVVRPPSVRHQRRARFGPEVIFGASDDAYVTLSELRRVVQHADGIVRWFRQDFEGESTSSATGDG
jgi:hypothetical protein